MAIRTSEEEKLLSEKRNERKQAIKKYGSDFLSSFLIGIKAGGIGLAIVIVAYLVAKFLFNWDLFYETDLEYTAIIFVVTIIFFVLVLLCCFIAFILYNTKHTRGTKYKSVNEGVSK